jgi:hypothetical protein
MQVGCVGAKERFCFLVGSNAPLHQYAAKHRMHFQFPEELLHLCFIGLLHTPTLLYGHHIFWLNGSMKRKFEFGISNANFQIRML